MSFGSGDCGQLAHGEDVDAVKYPLLIRSLKKIGICKIACGGLHNAAVRTVLHHVVQDKTRQGQDKDKDKTRQGQDKTR